MAQRRRQRVVHEVERALRGRGQLPALQDAVAAVADMAFDQDELARRPVPRDRHRIEPMSAIAERDMRAEPRLAIPGRDPVRREQSDETLIKLANGGDAPGRDEFGPGIAAADAAEGDDGGGGA